MSTHIPDCQCNGCAPKERDRWKGEYDASEASMQQWRSAARSAESARDELARELAQAEENRDGWHSAANDAEEAVLAACQRMFPSYGWDGCYDLSELLNHLEGQVAALHEMQSGEAAPE